MECGSYHDRVPQRRIGSHRRTVKSSRSVGTAKEQIQEILKTLPDDVSLEAIQYHIDLRQKIQHGWADADAGRMISLEEVQRRLANWLARWTGRAWSTAR